MTTSPSEDKMDKNIHSINHWLKVQIRLFLIDQQT